jgi:hypothetical protein
VVARPTVLCSVCAPRNEQSLNGGPVELSRLYSFFIFLKNFFFLFYSYKNYLFLPNILSYYSFLIIFWRIHSLPNGIDGSAEVVELGR